MDGWVFFNFHILKGIDSHRLFPYHKILFIIAEQIIRAVCIDLKGKNTVHVLRFYDLVVLLQRESPDILLWIFDLYRLRFLRCTAQRDNCDICFRMNE